MKVVKKMNKFLKVVTNFFITLYRYIDKIIITPLSKLFYNISIVLKDNDLTLEKILNRSQVLLYISLALAVGTFILIDSKVVTLVETEAEVINNQEVKVIYNEEAYVVEGIPETVDITLIGRKSDLYLAKQLGDHEVVLDLTEEGLGEHKVKLTYKQTIDSLTYKLDPSSVLVVIKEKVSELKTISYDLLNQDKLDSKLSVKDVTLDRSEVVVKGSKEALAKVANVKALINLDNDDLKESGKFTLDSLPLVAYDKKGKKLTNVEIVPSTTSASIQLDSYSSEVPIKIVPTGTYTVGYAISSIVSNVTNVTIYGDKDIISEIDYVPVEIDITGLTSSKTFNVTIPKPTGVRSISETSVSVEITMGVETSKEIEGVGVETRNLGSNYTVNASSINDTKVVVILKGISTVIDDIDASSITAYLDLSGYGPGEYDVPVKVQGTDARVQYLSKTSTIKVKISAK